MALHVELLEESFDLVAPHGDELMDRFYERVFTRAPEAQALFASADMPTQKRALLSTLIVLRNSLRKLDTVVPTLEALGARHAGYGVRPEHYPIVGEALLSTMAEVGGAQWRPEYTSAWAGAYGVVQETMLRGAVEWELTSVR